jgi:hypothetical protein
VGKTRRKLRRPAGYSDRSWPGGVPGAALVSPTYELSGETSASGSRARPSSGIDASAQSELSGPTTATTSVARPYARAFAAHFELSGRGVAATASSQDWYATRQRPARKPRCRKTNAIASAIC